jgi:putative iron-dependent peroxidase
MARPQPGILSPVPRFGRFLTFRLVPGGDPAKALRALASRDHGEHAVVGVGAVTAARLGRSIDGLRDLAALSGPGVSVPATPAALWCWLRGETDPGELLHRGRAIASLLEGGFEIERAVDAFKFDIGRDLSGYEDGTENPEGDAAVEAALVQGKGAHLDGGSFVAAQVWRHDLDALGRMSARERDDTVGRRLEDNEELADAPASAHVKRTAQESFTPEAFVVRRSMPWSEGTAQGLVFVSFGHSLDAFEAQLRRMVGLEDGITDALFRFTRPDSGAAFFCPPLDGSGKLDLGALGL